MAARDLLVRVLGDTRDVEAAFARSNRAATQFGASVETTGKRADKAAKNLRGFATGAAAGFGGAIALTEVTRQLRASIDVASNLAEQISKTNVVFGESADEVKAWADKTASSIGIASDQALAAASTFGSMFDQAGRSNEQAADLSQSVVQLAADLASFNNTSVDDALLALRSGLSGEIEPLRRFQVFLTEASVAAEAMAKSGKKSAKELSQGEKIMARWSLILQQTTKQQGDFGRTSEGLANQQRILAAQVRDLQADFGQLLLPVMTDLTTLLGAATQNTLKLADALRGLSSVKVPPIHIPLILDTGGGELDLGDVFDKAKDAFARGAETQFPGLAFVNDLVKLIENQPNPNTGAAADAFDAKFDTFLESLEKDVDKSTKRANAKLKAFGEVGFKPLEVNDLGERLTAQFQSVIDALDLQFDKAVFADNTQAALNALAKTEQVIRQRIATQGRTTDLLRQLFQVEQQRAGLLREGKEAAKAAAAEARELAREQAVAAREMQKALEQQRQFRAIGLSPEGTDIIPTVANLRKQFDQLSKNVVGQDVSSKLLARLKAVGNALSGGIKKLTPETRAAIKELFDAIRSEFDKETQKEIIPPRRLQINDKIMAALGFDQDEKVRAFRAAQQFTKAPSFPTGMRPFGVTSPTTSATLPPLHIHVEVDGEEIGNVLIRDLQKRAARTTGTARGRHAGKGLGLG